MSMTATAPTRVRQERSFGSERGLGRGAAPLKEPSALREVLSEDTSRQRAAGVLRVLWFPGSTDNNDSFRIAVWWIANSLIVQIAFWASLTLGTVLGAELGTDVLGTRVATGFVFLYGTVFTLLCQMEGLYRRGRRRKGETKPLYKAGIWALLFVEATALVLGSSGDPQAGPTA